MSKQLKETVEWYQVKNKCGWAAINSEKFPLIKDLGTINKQLNGVIYYWVQWGILTF